MLIHTSEEVCPSMNVEHYPVSLDFCRVARVVVRSRLDPLSFQCRFFDPPLPPFPPSYAGNSFGTQLRNERISSRRNLWLGDDALVDFDPVWIRNSLRSEGLNVLNGMERSIVKKSTD